MRDTSHIKAKIFKKYCEVTNKKETRENYNKLFNKNNKKSKTTKKKTKKTTKKEE